MILRCEACGQRFGGQFAYDRHLDRRGDRCRRGADLRLRGFVRSHDLIWHQRPANLARQLKLPGTGIRGSQTIEDRIRIAVGGQARNDAESRPPQQKNTGAA